MCTDMTNCLESSSKHKDYHLTLYNSDHYNTIYFLLKKIALVKKIPIQKVNQQNNTTNDSTYWWKFVSNNKAPFCLSHFHIVHDMHTLTAGIALCQKLAAPVYFQFRRRAFHFDPKLTVFVYSFIQHCYDEALACFSKGSSLTCNLFFIISWCHAS